MHLETDAVPKPQMMRSRVNEVLRFDRGREQFVIVGVVAVVPAAREICPDEKKFYC